MRRITCRFFFLLFCFHMPLMAHPHMFIDTQLDITLEAGNLKSIDITWRFDPLFTASIKGDFDENRDGRFDAREIALIREYAFTNLKNYDYFTFVNIEGKTHVPEEIDAFTARMEQETLVYEFTTSFNLPLEKEDFAVAIYDDTFWCDITYTDTNPVHITGNPGADWKLVENRDMAIQYDNATTIDRNGKTYSGTAYPQQIVVTIP